MTANYDIKPVLPSRSDGRASHLPRPAVNLAQRLAQLSNDSDFVLAHVVISKGEWNLQVDGKNEKLGSN